MKASGKDVRLELFPGQSHSFTNGPEGDDYHRALELTLQFIQKHTGGAKN